MKGHDLLSRLPLLVASPVGAVLATWGTSQLSGVVKNVPVLGVILVALFVLAAKLIEDALRVGINRSASFRRLILGEDYIEGWWVERLERLHTDPPRPTDATTDDFAIAAILYRDGAYAVEGHLFSPAGELKGSWESKFSTYAGGTLEYLFEGPWIVGTEPFTNHGYSRIKFVRGADSRSTTLFQGEVLNIGPAFNRTYFTGARVAPAAASRKGMTLREFALELRALTNSKPTRSGAGNDVGPRPRKQPSAKG